MFRAFMVSIIILTACAISHGSGTFHSSAGIAKVYHDEETDKECAFLTNDLDSSALVVADLYRNRWQVELFFKWLKQHLRIKKSWGTTENAVRIQIYCAIITYCLVAIVQHDMQLECSVYEVLQILSISLTDKTHIVDLFDKSNIGQTKEIMTSNEPSLFDFWPVDF